MTKTQNPEVLTYDGIPYTKIVSGVTFSEMLEICGDNLQRILLLNIAVSNAESVFIRKAYLHAKSIKSLTSDSATYHRLREEFAYKLSHDHFMCKYWVHEDAGVIAHIRLVKPSEI